MIVFHMLKVVIQDYIRITLLSLYLSQGGGGCDGCVNFEESVQHNHGLQVTVAVLEKLYREHDYPPSAEPLPKSPKELGISRADLWSFTALVALDRYMN